MTGGQDKRGDTVRVVLVTGAASGIGAAICRRLAKPDMRLMLHTGSRRAEVEAVAAGGRAKGATCGGGLRGFARPAVPPRLIRAATPLLGVLDRPVPNA